MSDKNVEIKVMMFGGRRCGKTSVLAAMQSCFEDKFGKTNLMIYADDDDTMISLEEKSNEISSYFHNQGRNRSFTPDSNATESKTEYCFHIDLKNKKTDGIVIKFIDYPGEWLDSKKYPDKYKELGEMVKEVHVIMIAIDSPHLMEQTHSDDEDAVGEFNDRRNYCSRIGTWIKRNFSEKSNLAAKMVLFVPLKCEKYYHNGQMEILNKKIHKAYKEVFNFFTNNEQQRYVVAITPILTCGDVDKGVEFDRFERNEETREIILEDEYQTPKKAFYIFTKQMAEPKPLYCEQPMIYILAYTLAMVAAIKYQQKSEVWFKKIRRFIDEKFFNAAAFTDFLNGKNEIQKAMKKTNDGYEIFSNPLGF